MTDADAAQLYRSGLSVAAIADRLGTSAHIARKLIVSAGGEIRPAGRISGFQAVPRSTDEMVALRQRQAATVSRSAAIAASYRSGKAMRQVGAEFGISAESVRQALAKVGEPARKTRGTGKTKAALAAGHQRKLSLLAERRRQEAPVLVLWTQGHTCREIADQLALSLSRVRSIVGRCGARKQEKPPRATYAVLTIEKAVEAARLRADGKRKRDIAAILHVPSNSVGRLLEKARDAGFDVPKFKRGGINHKAERNRALVEDYVSGQSYRDLAEKYSVSTHCVYAIISRAGAIGRVTTTPSTGIPNP